MGVVVRQSIKTSIVTLAGILLGVFNMLVVYTLDLEAYGFIQLLIATSLLVSPIASFGTRGVINRYFPHFKSTEESRGVFFAFGVLRNLIGAIFFALIGYFVLLPLLPRFASADNNVDKFVEYATIIYLITVGQMFVEFLDGYIQNYRLVTVQTVFMNLVPKLFTGILVYGAATYSWNYVTVGYGIIIMNLVIVLCLLTYLYSLGKLHWSFNFKPYFTKELRRSILSYTTYAIVGVISTKIALQIDTVSLGAFVDDKAVGVYRIIVIIAMFIDIPLRSMSRITLPIVAEAMTNKDYAHAEQLYRESSRTLTFIGLYIFTCLFVSLNDVFIITGKAEAFTGGLITFAFLGGSRLVNMITSINNQLVMYSHLYRYNLLFVVSLALMNIYFNWLMIVNWQLGIIGAALATFLSLTVYNLLRSLLVYIKLNIHPLTAVLIWPAMLSIAFISLFLWWPLDYHPIINMIVRSALISPAFLTLCWYTPYYPAIRKLLAGILYKVRSLI